MLHIIFLILKILLITVLILLGLAILLIILVLFVPVSFKLYAEKNEKIFCKMKASWLGFVFYFKANYDENGFLYWLKSFGGTLVTNEHGFEETHEESSSEEKKEKVEKKAVKKSKKEKLNESDSEEIEKLQFISDDSFLEKKKESIFTRIGRIFDSFIIKIKNKIEGFILKLKDIKKKANQYKKFLKSPVTKQALSVVKIYLIKLLKHIKPKIIKGNVHYGTGDAASTGTQLGYLSVLFPLYYDKVNITPDFREKVFEGDIFIKGRIRVYNILYYACRVYFNKYVKRTIAHFKKISGGKK